MASLEPNCPGWKGEAVSTHTLSSYSPEHFSESQGPYLDKNTIHNGHGWVLLSLESHKETNFQASPAHPQTSLGVLIVPGQ